MFAHKRPRVCLCVEVERTKKLSKLRQPTRTHNRRPLGTFPHHSACQHLLEVALYDSDKVQSPHPMMILKMLSSSAHTLASLGNP
jgi:hypothetical protein